jgi:signal peptidase I
VCPDCGQPAGERAFCASCGKNLMGVDRLPTREQWMAREKLERKATAPPAVEAPAPQRARQPRLLRVALFAAVPLAAVAAVVAVALAGGKSGAVTGVVANVPVPSASMSPTLPAGSTVHVLIAQSYAPRIGNIVVVHAPSGAIFSPAACGDAHQGAGHPAACDRPTPEKSSVTVIDRIVAGPGDTITIRDGQVIRDGVAERPAYKTKPCRSNPACNFPAPITIPQGHYFVLGDNRAVADDSRLWGPVPRAYIVGRVLR